MSQLISLGEIAELVDAELRGDRSCVIQAVAPLDRALRGQISFIESKKHIAELKTTQASAVLITDAFSNVCPTNALIVQKPKLALAKILPLFFTREKPAAGVHPSVVVGSNCVISATASIAAQSVIGDDVHIGDDTVIGPGVVVGNGVKIGENCQIEANVSLYHDVKIGSEVIIHSGVVIGADGFSYEPDTDGSWLKLLQLGSVIIGDKVEIGANTTIDRGALGDTVLEDGVKLDNLVMIAHNVHIGENTAIAGCVGIAGSTRIGRNCIIAGATAVADHVTLVDNVIVSGMSMVTKSLLEPGVYSSGTGIMPRQVWQRSIVRFKQLDQMYKRINKLEQNNDN